MKFTYYKSLKIKNESEEPLSDGFLGLFDNRSISLLL